MVLLPLTFVKWCGTWDVIMRYAPMAEAVAQGHWQDAFHPRFGVGFQLITGAWVWLTGIDGLTACQQLSVMGWCIGLPLTFRLAERLFDRRCAWVTVLLYVICPMLLYWALNGYREPVRLIGVLLMVLGILDRREGKSGFLHLLIAMPLMCTFRADTILIAIVFGMVYACYDRFRWRTWGAFVWGMICLQPTCWLAYHWTGVWLPSVQIVHFWQKVMGGGV